MYLLRLVTLTYLFRHRCHYILHASAVLQVALKKQKTKKEVRFTAQGKRVRRGRSQQEDVYLHGRYHQVTVELMGVTAKNSPARERQKTAADGGDEAATGSGVTHQ